MTVELLVAHGPGARSLELPGLVHRDAQFASWSQHAKVLAAGERHCAATAGAARNRPTAEQVLAEAERWAERPVTSGWHGMVVVFDRRSGRLVVHRDGIGLCHVYYTQVGQTWLIGTDLDAVVGARTALGRAAGLDPEAVAAYLSFQYVPAPRTIWRDVRQLLPGGTLVLEPGAPARTSAPGPRATAAQDGDPEQVADLVVSSLRRQVDPARPVAALVSGGVDTSTAITLLVEENGVRPTGFTAAFAEPEFDETPYARAVCEQFGLAHEVFVIGPSPQPEIDELAAALRTPHGDRALFAQHKLFREVHAAGFTQVVTGEGGDELLGYPRMRDGHEDLPRLPADPVALAEWYLERTCLAGRRERAELLPSLGIDPGLGVSVLAEHYAALAGADPFERVLYGQWLTWLPDGVLVKDAEAARWHGLDPVIPFASAELAGHVAALSPAAKRKWLLDKGLLRPRMARSLPERVLAKSKHKFWLPFADWFRGPWRSLLHDTLTDSSGVVAELDAGAVRRLLAEHDAGADHSRLLWALVVLARWEAAHLPVARATRGSR